MQHLKVTFTFEPLPHQMVQRTVASRPIAQILFFGQGNEFFQGVGLETSARGQNDGRARDHGQGCKRIQGLIVEFGVQGRCNTQTAGAAPKQGVAIGHRPRHQGAARRTASTRLVLNHHGLLEVSR